MLNANQKFTVTEAAIVVAMAPTDVSQMIFSGLIHPQIHVPNGSGDSAVLGLRNLRELILIKRLRYYGVSRFTIKQIIDCLAASSLNWWNEGGWLVGGELNDWFVTDNVFSAQNKAKIMSYKTAFIIRLE
jgi:hypothetical protein